MLQLATSTESLSNVVPTGNGAMMKEDRRPTTGQEVGARSRAKARGLVGRCFANPGRVLLVKGYSPIFLEAV